MSVRMKRIGKSLRARYGVAEGVRPAPTGLVCSGYLFQTQTGKLFCKNPAHVIEGGKGLCEPHMKQAHQTRRK